jgi:hypothetical protein
VRLLFRPRGNNGVWEKTGWLPGRLSQGAPHYRDYEYILVGDDILIVDPRTLRIVAVISA